MAHRQREGQKQPLRPQPALAGYRATPLQGAAQPCHRREFCTEAPLSTGPVPTAGCLKSSRTCSFVTLIEGFNQRDNARLAGAFAARAPCTGPLPESIFGVAVWDIGGWPAAGSGDNEPT